MVVIPLKSDLPVPFLLYGKGETNEAPDLSEHDKSDPRVRLMFQMRRSFIRNLLANDARKAYELPDFHSLMRSEIERYAQRRLKKDLFECWDERIREIPPLLAEFEKEFRQLVDNYIQRSKDDRPAGKIAKLHREAMIRAINTCVKDGRKLAAIELACVGETKYGIPDL